MDEYVRMVSWPPFGPRHIFRRGGQLRQDLGADLTVRLFRLLVLALLVVSFAGAKEAGSRLALVGGSGLTSEGRP
ncbi:MAG: hypothetical protein WC700_19680 [Gemmatimonadaceae bacterium]|jgi:hypothetical protein